MLKYRSPSRNSDLSSLGHKLIRIRRQELFKTQHQTRFNALTPREVEILTLIAEGYNNPKISERLFISRCTVEQHRKNIIRKLETRSLHQLFQYSLAFNLV